MPSRNTKFEINIYLNKQNTCIKIYPIYLMYEGY